MGFFLNSYSWMQLFQGKAFILRIMAGHFRTENEFLQCLCCLFHLFVHILICLLEFYLLSLQLVEHGSWWLGQFLWTLHSWGVFQRWQWWLIHLPYLLCLYGVKLLALMDISSLRSRNKKCWSLLCLQVFWLFFHIWLGKRRPSNNSGMNRMCIRVWFFFPNIFSFLFAYLNSPILYRNFNILGAEAVAFVAIVTAQKAKKELGCCS